MSDSRPKENISKTIETRNAPVRLSVLAIIAAGLAFPAIFYFAYVLYSEYNQAQINSSNAENTETTDKDVAPISILPKEPEGVTIIAKQPELKVEEDSVVPNTTVTSGAQITSGFGLQISSAQSFLELSAKFSELSELNGKENFHRLEPRAILTETINGLVAKLIIGPFESEAVASEACDVLILPTDSECNVQTFEGELIARE